ncbi:MAG: hypothetical protein Tsb009_12290 [Planctomycetaceae bacterium]
MKLLNWVRKFDARLFSPPHTFETIFGNVAVQLGLVEYWNEETRQCEETVSKKTTSVVDQ